MVFKLFTFKVMHVYIRLIATRKPASSAYPAELANLTEADSLNIIARCLLTASLLLSRFKKRRRVPQGVETHKYTIKHVREESAQYFIRIGNGSGCCLLSAS